MSQPKSTWNEQSITVLPNLVGNLSTDVLIIGGGITGILLAYELQQAGKQVAVIDKASLAKSVTAYTTAFLTYSIDTDFSDLIRGLGLDEARQVVMSHKLAIDHLESIINKESISCDFKRITNYTYAQDSDTASIIHEQFIAAQQLGLPAVFHEKTEFPFMPSSALELPEQAIFDPLRFCLSLREILITRGVRWYEQTEAERITGEKPSTVHTVHGSITCDDVVIATYQPFVQPWWYRFKKGMYVSYVYELEIPHGLIPEGQYEDDAEPYHYFRIDAHEEKDRLIVGGEDHRKGFPMDPEKNFSALRTFVTDRLHVSEYAVKHQWAGPILEPSDGLALIGRYSQSHPHRYVATAFSGNGMTYAGISALLITDLIMGKRNHYAAIYAPTRQFSLRELMIKVRDYTEEFFGGAVKNLFQKQRSR